MGAQLVPVLQMALESEERRAPPMEVPSAPERDQNLVLGKDKVLGLSWVLGSAAVLAIWSADWMAVAKAPCLVQRSGLSSAKNSDSWSAPLTENWMVGLTGLDSVLLLDLKWVKLSVLLLERASEMQMVNGSEPIRSIR